ncbi:MAG: metallophosphoesterase [bacterium]|nr:metallophosphoesterase [bacterium]
MSFRRSSFNRLRVLGVLTVLLAVAFVAPAFADPAPAGPFSLVLVPDTQCYADVRDAYSAEHWGNGDLRAYFYAQTRWINDNADDLNIAMVAHVGDITQTDYDPEWEIADKAFSMLDSTVPYILSLGNHDVGWGQNAAKSETSRVTNLNKWFPPSRFQENKLFNYGGNFDGGNDSYYLLFEAGGIEFVILSLEFKPRDEVLTWANEVLTKHAERRAVVVTHCVISGDGTFNDMAHYHMPGNGGKEMWEKCFSKHKNVCLVLCGHIADQATTTLKGDHGNTVHIMLADYQHDHNGGEGYLRILTVHPEANRIDVKTYSPFLRKYKTDKKQQFSLPFE